MPYATRQQMEDIIGKDRYLTVLPGGDARQQDAAADQALENASGIADSYITRWLPLQVAPPPALRDAVIWIATYNLSGDHPLDFLRDKFEDAMKWLRDVSAGKASLGAVDPGATPTSSGSAQLCARDRQMSRRTLSGVL